MKYSPGPGRAEGYGIGSRPEDKEVLDEVLVEINRCRAASEDVRQGDDLSRAVEEVMMEDADTRARLQTAATNAAVEQLRDESRKQRIRAIGILFRSLTRF